jgi:hypothetical protein
VAFLIGALLACAVGLFGTTVGMDRDRSFYAVVTTVIASYYALFAVMGQSTHALVLESLVGAVFVAFAVAGFKKSLWILVFALAGHGVFDLVHAAIVANPGVPVWWPPFCLAFDVVAAVYLAGRLRKQRIRA